MAMFFLKEVKVGLPQIIGGEGFHSLKDIKEIKGFEEFKECDDTIKSYQLKAQIQKLKT